MNKNILLILILISCSVGLFFFIGGEKPLVDMNKEGQELRLTVNVYKHKKAMNDHLIKLGYSKVTGETGFAVWNNVDNECNIYAVRPKTKNSSEFKDWGHELGHCVYGSFHK